MVGLGDQLTHASLPRASFLSFRAHLGGITPRKGPVLLGVRVFRSVGGAHIQGLFP
jgi:hypothetical protein